MQRLTAVVVVTAHGSQRLVNCSLPRIFAIAWPKTQREGTPYDSKKNQQDGFHCSIYAAVGDDW